MTNKHTIRAAAILLTSAAAVLAQRDTLPAGTQITVRTSETISAKSRSEGRIYNGNVDRDVLDRQGNVVIPRGSAAELMVRNATSGNIVLDIESVDVNGRRYTVSTTDRDAGTRSQEKEGVGKNKRTGEYVGGGALLGTIIGAVAGGGKGAAIGALAGAGAGAAGQTITKGGIVRVPAESVLTFRLDRPLVIGGPDTGYYRNGHHYHSEAPLTPDSTR
jgi:hypothetical protein